MAFHWFGVKKDTVRHVPADEISTERVAHRSTGYRWILKPVAYLVEAEGSNSLRLMSATIGQWSGEKDGSSSIQESTDVGIPRIFGAKMPSARTYCMS